MNTNNKVQTIEISKLFFLIAGALMIIAAILSAYSGLLQLTSYRSSLSYPFSEHDYRPVVLGVLYCVAFGVSLFGAMLLLLRKKPLLAKVLVATVMALGIATPIIYVLYPTSESILSAISNSTRWVNGLYNSLPMIIYAVSALILIRHNQRLQKNGNMQLISRPLAISGALMLIISVMSAYSVIQAAIDLRGTGDATYFSYLFLTLGVLSLGVFGAGLSAGKLLLKEHRVNLAVTLMALVLALAFPITAVAYLSLCIWSLSFIGIALATLTFSATALLIVRKYIKIKRINDNDN